MATSQPAARIGERSGEEQRTQTGNINVGRNERTASMAGGAALAVAGFNRIRKGHFLSGLSLLAAGGTIFYRGKTGHCSMYEQLGVSTARGGDVGITIEKSMTVNRPVQDVYQFWRRLENLPSFMRHLESVRMTGERTSHWRAVGPAGAVVEWDAETIEDHPGRLSWRSIGQADIPNRGVVEFKEAPGGRGTEVKVRIFYDPPGGAAGKAAAAMLNAVTAQQVEEDLKRCKQIIETGETTTAGMAPGQPQHTARSTPSRSFIPGGGART